MWDVYGMIFVLGIYLHVSLFLKNCLKSNVRIAILPTINNTIKITEFRYAST